MVFRYEKTTFFTYHNKRGNMKTQLVYMTAADLEEGRAIARILVEERKGGFP